MAVFLVWYFCVPCSPSHRVQVDEALVHLGVAEDGVALTHPPQHALKGLHFHPLDQTGDEPGEGERKEAKGEKRGKETGGKTGRQTERGREGRIERQRDKETERE